MHRRREPIQGLVLRKIRKRYGWTQKELSRRSHVSALTILNIEMGKNQYPLLDTVVDLANAMAIDVNDLYREELIHVLSKR